MFKKLSRENSRLLILTSLFSAAVLILALTLSLRENPRLAEAMADTDIPYAGIILDAPEPADSQPPAAPPAAPDDTGSDTVFLSSGDNPFTGDDETFAPAPAGDPPADPAPYPELPDGYVDPDDDGYAIGSGLAISGRVTDPWGRGIANVWVEAVPVSRWVNYFQSMTVTDDNGYYEFPLNTAGLYKIWYTAPGGSVSEWYNNSDDYVNAAAVPSGASGVDAVLMPTGILHVHLDFPDEYRAFNIVAYRADTGEIAATATNAVSPTPFDIYFQRFAALEPGDYKLRVIPNYYGAYPYWYDHADSWESAQRVTVRAGETTHIELSSASAPPDPSLGSLYGELFIGTSDYNLQSIGSADISLVDAHDENHVLATQHTANYYNFTDVPAGEYKLKATLEDGNVVWFWYDASQFPSNVLADFSRASVFTVNPGQATLANFGISTTTAYVSGSVKTESGDALPAGQWLSFYRNGDAVPYSGTIVFTETGMYSQFVTPGEYRVCVIGADTSATYCTESFAVGWLETHTGADITVPDDFEGLGWSTASAVPSSIAEPGQEAIPVPEDETEAGLPEQEVPAEVTEDPPAIPDGDAVSGDPEAADTEAEPTGGAPPGAQELAPAA